MSLTDDITSALPLLQVQAEGRMVDACTITRPTAGETFDPTTGLYDTVGSTTVYTGKCEVQISDGLNARQVEAGGTDLTISRVTVKIPVSITGVRVGDLVTVTAARDADLTGQQFAVIAGHAKTFATSRRLQVERVTT